MPFASFPNRACALVLAIALTGAVAPPRRPPPPASPPNGTYVYTLSRNGTDQGTTTVVIYHRDDAREVETDEAGSLGAAHVHVTAAYRYDDLSVASYTATYQAPFLRTSPVGAARRSGVENGFFEQVTLRYRIDGGNALASVDGAPSLPAPAPLPRESGAPKTRYVLDAPFMATVLMLPAFRHQTNDAPLAPVGAAFEASGDASTATMHLVHVAPQAPKTPKTDDALAIDGIGTIWFDPANGVVHEAHFDALNLDARLVSYARGTHPAPFEPGPTPAPAPKLSGVAVTFDDDGTSIDGVVDLPAAAKRPMPIVALIPPGPSASRNVGGEGPDPMFPDLARAFTARGYAVLRYDTRGIGRSGGSAVDETWEQSLSDAQAAIRAAADQDGVDPKRVYVAGYGSGADLALAASSTADIDVAGAIALAPTVVSYRTCGRQRAEVAAGAHTPGDKAKADSAFDRTAGRISDERQRMEIDGKTYDANDGTWQRTSFGHDPSVLAARAVVPLFVLHPGIPTCGETPDQTQAYDDRLRATNARAVIVAADDLSEFFGGRYDADSSVDTQEFFPYRFDPSTANAIADWLDSPKPIVKPGLGGARSSGPSSRLAPPPPPPAPNAGEDASGMPNPHATKAPPAPGQPALPATLGSPTPVITAPPPPAATQPSAAPVPQPT